MSQLEMLERVILIPEVISNKINCRLRELAELNQETNGVLLHLPINRFTHLECRVDCLYVTGIGSPHHVIADEQRIRIINQFFQDHPEYKLIKWHTHSKASGEYWQTNLSMGDIDSYKEQIREDPEFIGMMFSLVKRIVAAKGRISSKIIPTWPDFYEREQRLMGQIDRAAYSLGYYERPPLIATRDKR